MRLKHKTVLITGAASGIGAATGEACAREGAHVIALDLKPAPACSETRIADIGDEDQVRHALKSIDRLDGLVNAAGIARRAAVDETDAADWDAVIRTNLRGAFLIAKYAVPLMRAPSRPQNGGSIVHLASVAGLTGMRNRSAYSASKGAIVALTRSMAMDFAKDRIRVNCLCPGFTRTPLIEGLFADAKRIALLTRLHPLGRLGEPKDIAAAALFLVSDDSSWITGQAIAVDGGFTAGYAVDV